MPDSPAFTGPVQVRATTDSRQSHHKTLFPPGASRPSDAMAAAARIDPPIPIYVTEDITSSSAN